MFKRSTAFFASAILALCLTATAHAASAAWVRVLNIKTNDVSAYVHELDTARALMKKLGINATLRVYRATFAGPDTGAVVVTVEYPNWAAVADSVTKTAADPEYTAWQKSLEGKRTVVSDSLYREL